MKSVSQSTRLVIIACGSLAYRMHPYGIIGTNSKRGQIENVRCPGDTIHFMRFGYQEYVDRLVELAGIKPRKEWTLALRRQQHYQMAGE